MGPAEQVEQPAAAAAKKFLEQATYLLAECGEAPCRRREAAVERES